MEPLHFGTDPDQAPDQAPNPGIFVNIPSRRQLKIIFFCLLLFEATFTFFKEKNS